LCEGETEIRRTLLFASARDFSVAIRFMFASCTILLASCKHKNHHRLHHYPYYTNIIINDTTINTAQTPPSMSPLHKLMTPLPSFTITQTSPTTPLPPLHKHLDTTTTIIQISLTKTLPPLYKHHYQLHHYTKLVTSYIKTTFIKT